MHPPIVTLGNIPKRIAGGIDISGRGVLQQPNPRRPLERSGKDDERGILQGGDGERKGRPVHCDGLRLEVRRNNRGQRVRWAKGPKQ